MCLEPQRVDADKACTVGLIKATSDIHTGELLVVERAWAVASNGHTVAFVEAQDDGAVDELKAFLDGGH